MWLLSFNKSLFCLSGVYTHQQPKVLILRLLQLEVSLVAKLALQFTCTVMT
jgi:hypothetical protein